MKKWLSNKVPVVLAIMAAALLLLPLGAQAEKTFTLRLAAVFPPPTVNLASYATKLWMDEVTKRTGGKVTFKAFWGGALRKPAAHLTLVERGMADLVLTHRWYTPGKLSLGEFEYVFPFGPVDPVIVTKAKRQIHEEFTQFAKNLAKYNAMLILSGPGTPYQILAKEPFKTLQGFKGKKISLIGRYFGRWVKPAGAVPVVAPAASRYTMLQTGVVDMDFLPLDLFASYKIQEQAPNLILVDALTACWYELLLSLRTYKKLPAKYQKVLVAVGKEIELRMAEKEVAKWNDKVMAQFKKSGVKVIKFSPAERAKWAQLVEDIPAEWAAEVSKQGFPGWKIVQRYQELTTKIGYKWPRQWGVKK